MHRQACSDFFLDADNITSTLIRPLQERNISVETFLHSTTYCAASDARLVRFLQPVRHAFAPSNLPRIVDSYLQVMSMVEAYAVDRERVTSSNESLKTTGTCWALSEYNNMHRRAGRAQH